MSQKLITLEEAAEVLGMSPAELSTLRERGEVRAFRDGASWKFKQDDVERVAAERRARSSDEAASSDSDELLDLPLSMDDESDDVVLLSEVELGESDPSTSSTIIGKPGSGQAPDESDIKLTTKNDSGSTAPPPMPPVSDEEPEVQITSRTTKPAPAPADDDLLAVDSDDESDFDLSLGSDDEDVSLLADVESEDSSDNELLGMDFDSDDDFALADEASSAPNEIALGEEDDDDAMVLRSGPGSDITGSSDSGISLLDPSDSGLSLDQPLDLGEDSEEMMGLDGDDQFDLSEDSEAASLGSDEDFMLTPMEDAESQESGSQVIALDDSGEVDDFGEAGMFEEGAGEEMVSMVDEEDALGGGFDDDMAGDDLGGGELAGATGGAVLAPAARGTEAHFSGLQVLSLGLCVLLLVFCGMFLIDLMRNMWSWEGAFSANSSLMDTILGLFEG